MTANVRTRITAAMKSRLEWQRVGFRWLSGVEANGTQVSGQFASTPLSERITEWQCPE